MIMESWQTKNLTDIYLQGVRGAIPFADEQIAILLRIIRHFKPNLDSFLDLGCGDGVLGKALYSNWNGSKGIFIDYSEPMITAAKVNCKEYQGQSVFIVGDFGTVDWIVPVENEIPVDVVVSGFSIHHQNDENKQRVYKEIFDRLLKPGGVFLNLEQVKSPSKEIESLFNEFFLDDMRRFQKENSSLVSMETIEAEFFKDKKINKLAPVEKQCDWLR